MLKFVELDENGEIGVGDVGHVLLLLLRVSQLKLM